MFDPQAAVFYSGMGGGGVSCPSATMVQFMAACI